MGYFDTVRAEAQPIWDAVMAHPFIRGLGDGTLPEETFRYYLGQDYKYLVQYAKARALAIVKADDLETMRIFADGVAYILGGETLFHQQAAEFFGCARTDFLEGSLAPTAQAYTDYLLHVGYNGTLGEIVAACLPCAWGYGYVGQRLQSGGLPAHPLYAAWIELYAGQPYLQRVDWLSALFDRIAKRASDAERAAMRHHYLTCSRYEWLFFNMGWRRETWPV